VKLLSVNVSLPKEIEYKGKIVKTGIFKEPVEGTIFSEFSNDSFINLSISRFF